MKTDAKSESYSKFGVGSLLTALITVLASLLLGAASFLPDSSTDAAAIMYGVTFVFVFIIAPLFYLLGLLLGCVDLFKRRTAKKRYAIFGVLLNAFCLALSAVGWVGLVLMFVMFIIKAASVWH